VQETLEHVLVGDMGSHGGQVYSGLSVLRKHKNPGVAVNQEWQSFSTPSRREMPEEVGDRLKVLAKHC
jgi:hypothetical protein